MATFSTVKEIIRPLKNLKLIREAVKNKKKTFGRNTHYYNVIQTVCQAILLSR